MGKRTYRNTPEPRYVQRAQEADNAGEVTPEVLSQTITASKGIVADLSQSGTKVEIHLDMTGAAAGKILKVNSDATDVNWANDEGLPEGGVPGQFLKFINTGPAWANIPTPESIYLTPLTLTQSGAVWTSTETFSKSIHIMIEIDTSATHSSVGVDLHKYNAVESLSVARVTVGGQFYDVICKIGSTGAVMIDTTGITGITSLTAEYHVWD